MNNTNLNNKLGFIYILLAAVFFAFGGLLIKLNTWNSVTLNGVRCVFAFCVLSLYMKKIGHKFVLNPTVIAVAFINFGMNLSFVQANRMTTAANAIVLQFTQPIFIILLLWLVWKNRPTRRAVIACIAAFGGIACFFFDSLSPTGFLGNLLAIFSGLLYALIFLSKKLKYQDYESSVLVSFVLSFATSIPFILREPNLIGTNLLLAFILGVVQQGIATICLARGLAAVTPLTASLTGMVEPILNPIIVAIFYHEMIGPISILGAAIVLGAATIYNVLNIVRPEKEAAA